MWKYPSGMKGKWKYFLMKPNKENLLLANLTLSEVKWKLHIHVHLFVTPWTIQFMEFSRPEY